MSAPDVRTPGGNRANAGESTESTAIIAPDDDWGNAAIERVTTALELAGFSVHRLEGAAFLVCKWGLTKHCPDARTLAGFAHQVGARA
jgi:hypothetical protein